VRKSVLLILVLLAIAGYVAILPPAARQWTPAPFKNGEQGIAPARQMHGAVHIHSRRSDGTGTVEQIAAAAARAGLDFIVVTDHGDATRKPDPPVYRGSVLVIDAVEISTSGGHIVALGLGQAPYGLAGEPRDVVGDVARLGGFSIAAHPGSAKPELRFSDWGAAVNGLEWINADSEWRDESRATLLRGLFTYFVRGPESVATLLDRPDDVIRRWDELTKMRRVIGLPATDAHARIGLRSFGEPYTMSNVALRVPSYETMFRTMTIVVPNVARSGDALRDSAAVLAAIEGGAFYSRIDAVAPGGAMRFTARSGTTVAGDGELLPIDGPVTLRVDLEAPADAVVTLFKDGVPIRQAHDIAVEEPVNADVAVYRAEVALAGAPGMPPVPWMMSNPIYVGRAADGPDETPDAVPHVSRTLAIYDNGDATPAKLERSDMAQAALDVVGAVDGRQLLFRYAIGGRLSDAPYAAVSFPATNVAQFDRVTFSARADHPMRLAVQLRVPGAGPGERWQRSVYLDETSRMITIPFAELRPVPGTDGQVPLDRIDSLLFVVDTVNTKPGGSGSVWLDAIKFER
jgi:hypothetical protein